MIKKLKDKGSFVKIENINNKVPYGDRSNTIIEPLLTEQWFVDAKKLSDAIIKIVDLSPKGIINHLALKKPIYTKTSCYGHFGRAPSEDGSFSWEKLDLAEKLLSELS